jgi:hypothetical protein
VTQLTFSRTGAYYTGRCQGEAVDFPALPDPRKPRELLCRQRWPRQHPKALIQGPAAGFSKSVYAHLWFYFALVAERSAAEGSVSQILSALRQYGLNAARSVKPTSNRITENVPTPLVPVRRRGHQLIIDDCPFCHERHYHGDAGNPHPGTHGHRLAHCRTGDFNSGYTLIERLDEQA